ncbi:hypothetical protein SAMN05421780_10295 [Flexibacter flexilis DSM 6793]|uniref:WD40-like Beta Propeller Repeat n=1 Tax=Flexibacter flexilis DSM 6793 TaxID=927664 RepID=A0A1I1F8P5_9BACT|nr:hypothetical protein [Flexibacter flexilis]SFB95717.1 hypothetical protein SAMN05421780_10295 [Flexibacter flexilis DSM 6793]
MRLFIRTLCIYITVLCLFGQKAQAQAAQEEYGKNRIQYQVFKWQYITTNNFIIFYYDNNEALARTAAQYAETEFSRLSDLFGFSSYSRIRLYVYASKADLQQSNVGLEQENSIVGGRTNFIKSIVEVPFAGNQIAFRKEISRGVAQTLLNDMMYGGSFKDVVQNNYLLLLPDWFIGGGVRYASDGWSIELDDQVRDAMSTRRWRKPSNLLGEEAEIAGQSIWNYIAEKYGRANISNILNLTRIMRNEENSIGSTLAIPYEKLIRDWRNYYSAMADAAAASYKTPEKTNRISHKTNRKWVYNDLAVSENGQLVAYTQNYEGRYRVLLLDRQTGRQSIVWKGGNRLLSQRVDYQTPILAWQGNAALHVISLHNAQPEWLAYDVATGKKTKTSLAQFKQVYSFDVTTDGKNMVLAAQQEGQSDIFLFNIVRGNVTNLTKDFYDDQQPQFIGNESIVFSSNRLSDTLGKSATYKDIFNNYNLFELKAHSKTLKRLTNTVFNETRPRVLDKNNIVFLSDEFGINNLKKLDLATGQCSSISEWEYSVKNFDVNENSQAITFILKSNNQENLYQTAAPANWNSNLVNLPTRRQDMIADRIYRQNVKSLGAVAADTAAKLTPPTLTVAPVVADTAAKPVVAPKDTIIMLNTNEIDIRNYVFESEKIRKSSFKPSLKPQLLKPSLPTVAHTEAGTGQSNVSATGPFEYLNRLGLNTISTTATLDPLRGLGFLMEATMTDMFENHKIKAGFLPFSDLRSSNIFMEYQYLKRRVDFKARMDKQSYYYSNESLARRYNLNKAQLTAAYPLSLAHRIEVSPFVAQTRYVNLDDGAASMSTPDVKQLYSGIGAEYVYDHTVSHGINMLEGTRGKVRFEQYFGMGNSQKSFGNLHIDLRHYQPIHKELVLALRGSFGHFFGNAAKKYSLGGMDNWIGGDGRFNRSDNEHDPLLEQQQGDQNVDWLFMQFATNLRGFKYNTMYGRNYMLFNAELRIPIVRYLYRGTISSNFLRNFQLVAFADAGTAWQSGSPLDRDSNFGSKTTYSNPFTITVNEFYNPILSSYGAGLRTMILGYYVKADMAWGVQNYEVLSPRFYFTLGYDF